MKTKKTVLIVDDDDLVLESIDLHLSATGDFQTIRVLGSAAALSYMRSAPIIDVIVADVILAGSTSGIDICRRAIEQYPGIAVVVITADPEVHCAEIPEGGVFLRKPFGGEQLLEAIEEAETQAGGTADA
ncbi:response regulator [Rhodanobacter terrae]|uniref:Response regulator n=1 Tax=Rhodanobacter terrae TaxID=418647 RepID=A0ABW0T038_9GAMM